MANIPVVVALVSPLIHARLRAELARDPDVSILCDTDNPAKAAEQIAARRPPIVLVDREMVLRPELGQLAEPLPAVVLVTVHREGVPAGHVLPVAGTLAFDARPGEISRILRGVMESMRVQAAPAPVLAPEVPDLKSRFTMAAQTESAAQAEPREPASHEKAPMPSKTSQLTKTGFLRSVFDVGRAPADKASTVR